MPNIVNSKYAAVSDLSVTFTLTRLVFSPVQGHKVTNCILIYLTRLSRDWFVSTAIFF